MQYEPTSPYTLRESRIASHKQRWTLLLFVAAAGYLMAAYVVAPAAWKRVERRHPSLDANPRVTSAGDGHPGDPLNVALIGTDEELKSIMAAGEWYQAAKLGVKSDVKIALDTVLKRPDDEAPVSNLYLFRRKEDYAFEQPVGGNPRQRHHVRFWKSEQHDGDGRPYWLGAATYDEKVGFSHTTGQITHHVAPDVDTERGHVFTSLEATGKLIERYKVVDFHQVLTGKNGGGDRWHTDGDLWVGVIAPGAKAAPASAR